MTETLRASYKKLIDDVAANIVNSAFFPKDLKYVKKYSQFYMADLTNRVLKEAEKVVIQRKEDKK